MDTSLEEGGRDKNKEISTRDFCLLGATKQCPTKGLKKGSENLNEEDPRVFKLNEKRVGFQTTRALFSHTVIPNFTINTNMVRMEETTINTTTINNKHIFPRILQFYRFSVSTDVCVHNSVATITN